MLFYLHLWLFDVLQVVEAHNCRSLYMAFGTNLKRRGWNAWTNETCWEQCFVVREDFSLIMNNDQHTQYEWCIPNGRSGMCIVDQGIRLHDNNETCGCTIMTRFPRILKDNQRDKKRKSCKVDDIKSRLSVPRGGKYTDFSVIWKPTLIPMNRTATKTVEWVDYVENGHNVECAVSVYRAHEHCGPHGECTTRISRWKSVMKWVNIGPDNIFSAWVWDIKVMWWMPAWQKYVCEPHEGLNLLVTAPKDLFYRSIRSMAGLQLDKDANELPIIPY